MRKEGIPGSVNALSVRRKGGILKSMETNFMTVREVAQFLRISEITVYRLAEAKTLPGRKHGKQWRFPKNEIEEWSKWNWKG
jgi:excisionase family DNA binding protein